MHLFGMNRNNPRLEKEVSGIVFRNPIGSPSAGKSASFFVATPPKDNVINWISSFKRHHPGQKAVLDISEDIQRLFSLSYDFADIIVINPDRHGGINAMDISDTVNLLDSLLSLRLCYEKYTPVYLRIADTVTPDELSTLLSYCRMSGIDGIVAQGLNKVKSILELSQKRIPVIGSVTSTEEALQVLKEGASLVELNASPISVKRTIKLLEKS